MAKIENSRCNFKYAVEIYIKKDYFNLIWLWLNWNSKTALLQSYIKGTKDN